MQTLLNMQVIKGRQIQASGLDHLVTHLVGTVAVVTEGEKQLCKKRLLREYYSVLCQVVIYSFTIINLFFTKLQNRRLETPRQFNFLFILQSYSKCWHHC